MLETNVLKNLADIQAAEGSFLPLRVDRLSRGYRKKLETTLSRAAGEDIILPDSLLPCRDETGTKWAKRLRVWLFENEIRVSDIDFERVIQRFALYTAEFHNLRFAYRRQLDWTRGEYGDEDSCFWTDRRDHRSAIDNDERTGAIVVRNASDSPVGRCLFFVLDESGAQEDLHNPRFFDRYVQGIVLFNAYGNLSRKQIANGMLHVLEEIYDQHLHVFNVRVDSTVWVNNESATVIALPRRKGANMSGETIVLDIGPATPMFECGECGDSYPIIQRFIRSGLEVCAECNNLYRPCEVCSLYVHERDIYDICLGDTEELQREGAMVHACRPCADYHFHFCYGCGRSWYKGEVPSDFVTHIVDRRLEIGTLCRECRVSPITVSTVISARAQDVEEDIKGVFNNIRELANSACWTPVQWLEGGFMNGENSRNFGTMLRNQLDWLLRIVDSMLESTGNLWAMADNGPFPRTAISERAERVGRYYAELMDDSARFEAVVIDVACLTSSFIYFVQGIYAAAVVQHVLENWPEERQEAVLQAHYDSMKDYHTGYLISCQIQDRMIGMMNWLDPEYMMV